jgi:glutamine amidotransferase PdxT
MFRFFEELVDPYTPYQETDTPPKRLFAFLRAYAEPFRAVFIRAPLIESVDGEAHTLLTLPDGGIVAARQGRLLATSFHPELTDDDRIHRYFLEMAR